MSKITVLKEGKQNLIMANMSAEILRNIVSSVFKLKANEIKLSGEIAADKTWQNHYKNGSMGSNEDKFYLYGFNPKEGFIDFSAHVGYESSSNYAHSERYDVEGTKLWEMEKMLDCMFIVVNNTGYSAWEGSEQEEWNNWTIYKLPNFQEILSKIEETDIDRWKQWFENKEYIVTNGNIYHIEYTNTTWKDGLLKVVGENKYFDKNDQKGSRVITFVEAQNRIFKK